MVYAFFDGHKPKTTEDRLKRGRKKIQAGEIKETPGEPPIPPDVAASPGKLACWRSVVGDLSNLGVLQATDGEMIALCARTLHRLAQVEAELDASDSLTVIDKRGDLKPHPLLAIQQTYTTKADKLLCNLRLSPSTRSKTLPLADEDSGWMA